MHIHIGNKSKYTQGICFMSNRVGFQKTSFVASYVMYTIGINRQQGFSLSFNCFTFRLASCCQIAIHGSLYRVTQIYVVHYNRHKTALSSFEFYTQKSKCKTVFSFHLHVIFTYLFTKKVCAI